MNFVIVRSIEKIKQKKNGSSNIEVTTIKKKMTHDLIGHVGGWLLFEEQQGFKGGYFWLSLKENFASYLQ